MLISILFISFFFRGEDSTYVVVCILLGIAVRLRLYQTLSAYRLRNTLIVIFCLYLPVKVYIDMQRALYLCHPT